MGNTNPWAATNGRASLVSLDKLQAASRKQQATSFKLRQSVIYAPGTGMVIWSRAARELVSTIRYKPCEACIRGEAGGSSQQQKGKSRPRFSWGHHHASHPEATSHKPQAPSCSRCKRQASSVEQQASSFKPQAASSRTLCPS
jgi:hypothetical protein